MARLGTTKKKKSPHADELSQLKEELRRVTERLGFRERELAQSAAQQMATSKILGVIASSPTDLQPCWIRLQRTRRGCAMLPTRRSGR